MIINPSGHLTLEVFLDMPNFKEIMQTQISIKGHTEYISDITLWP